MRCFDAFAERSEVRRIVDTAMELDFVQGVVFELDPGWLIAWRLEETFGPNRSKDMFERWWRWPVPFPLWSEQSPFQDLGLSPHWVPSRFPTPSDVEKWQPPFWKEYQTTIWGRVFDSPAVIIKICLTPPVQGEVRELPRFEEENLNVTYETRPRARLFSGSKRVHNPLIGGTSIGVGTSDYATLGGLLRDENGKFYGVTCGHVARAKEIVYHPARADSAAATRVGEVAFYAPLNVCPSGSPCSHRATGSYINDVDVALIEIDPPVVADLSVLGIGSISAIRPAVQLVQGMAVQLTGRSSGLKTTLQFGGNGVYYKIPNNEGGEYCVRNTIELKEPSYYRNLATAPIDEGDSGAWVVAAGPTGNDWCAMVVGGDRFTGFAIESETIADWWRRKPQSLKLSVS